MADLGDHDDRNPHLLALPVAHELCCHRAHLRVGVLQSTGNDPSLSRLAYDLGRAGAQLIVGPEGLLPESPLLLTRGPDLIAGRQAQCDRHEGRRCVENTLVHFDSAGALSNTYAKRFLVPLYERDIGPLTAAGRISMRPGHAPGVFMVHGVATGGLICYEIMSPDGASELAAAGVEWIVHPTSDLWQRDERGVRQHLALAQVRAAEYGLPVLRVSNVLSSALIDPFGRISWALPRGVRSGLVEVSVGGRKTLLRSAPLLAEVIRLALAILWLLLALLFTRRRGGPQ